ncbi:hypothetical protein [Burkholderia gladioli]|uniref:hypothetical protein n=1 Tax=Burkholderia gladioli TaxID=28095 RepID=UPI00163F5ED1|nr:hypothetical protein [Burkholderia gladioli]
MARDDIEGVLYSRKFTGGTVKDLQRTFSVLAVIAVVLVISDFGATSMGTRSYDPTLMASWVQAVGSIAAVLGALWIAFRQDLKSQHAARQAALITASGMTFRLRQNLSELGIILNELEVMAMYDYNFFRLEGLANRLRDLRKWSSDEEIALIALEGDCAINLAAARDRLHFAPLRMQEFIESADCKLSDKRRDFAAKISNYLAAGHEHLMHASEACVKATERLRSR